MRLSKQTNVMHYSVQILYVAIRGEHRLSLIISL